jgi:hypothetical protein
MPVNSVAAKIGLDCISEQLGAFDYSARKPWSKVPVTNVFFCPLAGHRQRAAQSGVGALW